MTYLKVPCVLAAVTLPLVASCVFSIADIPDKDRDGNALGGSDNTSAGGGQAAGGDSAAGGDNTAGGMGSVGGTGGMGGMGGAPSAYEALIRSEPKLLGYWRLGEQSGASTAISQAQILIPNDADGTYVGDTHMLGVPGLIANDTDTSYFGGAGSHVLLAIPTLTFEGLATFSIEAWVRMGSDADAEESIIFSKRAGDTGYALKVRNRRVRAVRCLDNLNDNTPNDCLPVDAPEFPAQLATETTYHVVATYDSGQWLRVFVDAVEVTSFRTGYRLVADDTTPITIGGGLSSGSNNHFRGRLDEVAVYSDALTPEAIAEHQCVGRDNCGTAQAASRK